MSRKAVIFAAKYFHYPYAYRHQTFGTGKRLVLKRTFRNIYFYPPPTSCFLTGAPWIKCVVKQWNSEMQPVTPRSLPPPFKGPFHLTTVKLFGWKNHFSVKLHRICQITNRSLHFSNMKRSLISKNQWFSVACKSSRLCVNFHVGTLRTYIRLFAKFEFPLEHLAKIALTSITLGWFILHWLHWKSCKLIYYVLTICIHSPLIVYYYFADQ